MATPYWRACGGASVLGCAAMRADIALVLSAFFPAADILSRHMSGVLSGRAKPCRLLAFANGASGLVLRLWTICQRYGVDRRGLFGRSRVVFMGFAVCRDRTADRSCLVSRCCFCAVRGAGQALAAVPIGGPYFARFAAGAQRICAEPCADRPALEFAAHGLGRMALSGAAGSAYRHLRIVAFGAFECRFYGCRASLIRADRFGFTARRFRLFFICPIGRPRRAGGRGA